MKKLKTNTLILKNLPRLHTFLKYTTKTNNKLYMKAEPCCCQYRCCFHWVGADFFLLRLTLASIFYTTQLFDPLETPSCLTKSPSRMVNYSLPSVYPSCLTKSPSRMVNQGTCVPTWGVTETLGPVKIIIVFNHIGPTTRVWVKRTVIRAFEMEQA